MTYDYTYHHNLNVVQCPLIDYNTHIATCQMRETVLPPPITDPPIEYVNNGYQSLSHMSYTEQ